MDLAASIRTRLKSARRNGARWVRVVDLLRLLASREGQGVLATRLRHPHDLHQTTPQTAEDRYPELFDLAARLRPDAARILSFGCSTGAELAAIRARFPAAAIVGAEINRRSRSKAGRRMDADQAVKVVPPQAIDGRFDLIFCMAVLQREPMKVAEMELQQLGDHYPFDRFDAQVETLVEHLEPNGILCVDHCHYRVEDSRAMPLLNAEQAAPAVRGELFGPDGRRSPALSGRTMFRKTAGAVGAD